MHYNKSFLCIGSLIPQITLEIICKYRTFTQYMKIPQAQGGYIASQTHKAERTNTPASGTKADIYLLDYWDDPLVAKSIGPLPSSCWLSDTIDSLKFPSFFLWPCDFVLFYFR